VLGKPVASVVAFASTETPLGECIRRWNAPAASLRLFEGTSISALEVGDLMSRRGWHLNALSGPAAVHIACTVSL
jgi:hypothetical protein